MKMKFTAMHALIAFAFCAGISMPLARVFLGIALVWGLVEVVRGKRKLEFPSSAWGWLVYVVVAVVVTVWVAATLPEGALIDPRRGLRKVPKLLWYMGVFVVPMLGVGRRDYRRVLSAFVLGCAVYSVGIVVAHLPVAWLLAHFSQEGRGVWTPEAGSVYAGILTCVEKLGLLDTLQLACRKCGAHGSYTEALSYLSGMGPGQRLMAGALASLGLCVTRGSAGQSWLERWGMRKVVFAVVLAGLVVTLKRGSLLVFLLVGGIAMLRSVGWRRGLLAVAVVVAMVFAVPASRERLLQIPDEFRFEKGGRALMWTNLAPAMREAYPWGVGFRGLTYPSLRYATDQGWRLEVNQNHLHNNFLQVTVELGYVGLTVYLVWMGIAFAVLRRRASTPWRGGEGDALEHAIPLMIVSGLFLNGFVEYNLAEGEVTLIYGLMMGLAHTTAPKGVKE